MIGVIGPMEATAGQEWNINNGVVVHAEGEIKMNEEKDQPFKGKYAKQIEGCKDNKWDTKQKKKVKDAYSIGATHREVAFLMGINESTLHLYLLTEWGKKLRGKGISKGKLKLRKKLYNLAQAGNEKMLIHLSKAWLGNNEKQVIEDVTQEKPVINIKFVGDE